MDIKAQLQSKYDNLAIHTAGFYADPEDNLNVHTRLLETLKSFVATQHADDPFALQIMTTHSEINIMPLGLLNLNELKQYEDEQRQKSGQIISDDETTPLLVQFAPHTENDPTVKQIVGTTEELFSDFNGQFDKIWTIVKDLLHRNQLLLQHVENDLIQEAHDTRQEYRETLKHLSDEERTEKLGFSLESTDVEHFANFMTDMHEVQAITQSAAKFVQTELISDGTYNQVMADSVLRSTFFWVLDNTFYEIFYYFVYAYQPADQGDNVVKHLHHQKQLLLINMRNDAYQRSEALMEDLQKQHHMNEYFTDTFVPVAEQIITEIDKVNA